jgi:hypothetical protein
MCMCTLFLVNPSDTFIIVALRWRDRRTPDDLASAICTFASVFVLLY